MDFNESNLTVSTEDGSVERRQDGSVQRATDAPLGTEFASPSEELGNIDPLAGAAVGKRVNGGFILIVAVILSAVAGLFSMRKLAQVTAAAGIDTQVEKTIEGFLDSLAGPGSSALAGTDPDGAKSTENVLEVINSSYAEHQVALEDVKRDPFRLESEGTNTVDPIPSDPEAEAERRARELQQKKDATRDRIIAAADGLSLKSIVGGSTKMALIGKDIVRAGESVTNSAGDISFRVTGITTSSVDLVAKDEELELTVNVTIYLDR